VSVIEKNQNANANPVWLLESAVVSNIFAERLSSVYLCTFHALHNKKQDTQLLVLNHESQLQPLETDFKNYFIDWLKTKKVFDGHQLSQKQAYGGDKISNVSLLMYFVAMAWAATNICYMLIKKPNVYMYSHENRHYIENAVWK